jgi:hypothetical protein
VLARLAELDVEPGRIGEHLGIAHFSGLGELDGAQLERVTADAARQLSRSAIDLATFAWTAFRADDPRGLATIAKRHHPDLRFLAEAFDRLSREYPSTRDGLSLTERRILAAVAEESSTAGAAFAQIGARETRPFLGDSFYFRIVSRLANTRTPVLEAEGPHVAASTRLGPTPVGRRVLDGEDDHIRLNGIDRWIGGVHLAGDEAR